MFFSSRLLAAAIFSNFIATTDLALAGQDRLPPENQCLAQAYVIDSSQEGLNVRQQPNSSGKILGRLLEGTEVNILGMQGQ